MATPLDEFEVTIAFHGHAHHGTYEGKTKGGVPVFNVARPILKEKNMVVSYHEI